MQLAPQQEAAHAAVVDWMEQRDRNVFRLFGYAGTGKTTIAKQIARTVSERWGRVSFGAYTGKAASVLRSKGCSPAQTIHGLTYKLVGEDEKGNPTFEFSSKNLRSRKPAMIIIDECSMVDEQMGRDLLSHGIPILVLGDPAQLPPVSGAGYFTSAKPDVLLTDVHRQGEDSGIIKLATLARSGNRLPEGVHDESRVIGLRDLRTVQQSSFDQILVGTNKARAAINAKVRADLGFGGALPSVGEKVICLRNDHKLRVMNGETGIVLRTDHAWTADLTELEIDFDGNVVTTFAPTAPFLDPTVKVPFLSGQLLLDFGYAITVHKSQGSQWDHVLLHDESRVFRDDRHRWLYTGVTRAAKSITIVAR